MIPILYAMIRSRRTQALSMLLLAAIATLAAIAGPAYLNHIDATVAARQLKDATAVQRTIEFKVSVTAESVGSLDQTDPQLTTTLADMPGFATVHSSELLVALMHLPGQAKPPVETLLSRQDSCLHITIVSGRCMVGVGEVMLPAALAHSLHLAPGDPIELATTIPGDGLNQNLGQLSEPVHATVTGIYAPTAPKDAYWGPSPYFAAGTTPPIMSDDATVDALPQGTESVTTLAIANPSMFGSDLSNLSAAISSAQKRAAAAQVKTTTQIPVLIGTINDNEAVTSRLIPVAAIPLIALAWFVIFLAAAYTAAALRFEYGVVALRGSPRVLRWWLAAGENVTMILIGTFASYGIMRIFEPVSIVWALIALAGSVLAAVGAVAKPVSSAAAPLLRRIPAAVRGMGSRAGLFAEILIVMAAIAAAIQLRIAGGNLRGVTLLVPGLIILGTATAASFGVIPIARRVGRRALGQGRVATAIAAFGIGRRPGAQRLLILMAVAVGLLAFAASGQSVASIGRGDLATVQTGAVRVVSIAPATRSQILAAVEAADPEGLWAMAVVGMPGATPGVPQVLAVDATRLAAVATWGPAYGPRTAAQVAVLLHPSGYAAPVTFTGSTISVDVTGKDLAAGSELSLGLDLVPLDGTVPETAVLGGLVNGDATLTGPVPCATGCRLAGFAFEQGRLSTYKFTETIRSVRADGKEIIGSTAGSDWTGSNGSSITSAADGATIVLDSLNSNATHVRVTPAPTPLPIVTTSQLPKSVSISMLDGTSLPVKDVAVLPGLPRLGRNGSMVDLGYANLTTNDDGASINPEVWLGPKAPADALARLAAHGLIIAGTTTPAAEVTDLNEQGPAAALRFHLLAALLAVLLAMAAVLLIAVVDRGPRSDELAALRVQGVSARTVGRAASAGYTSIAAIGSVIGLASAALAWWVAGGYLPIFTAAQSIWPAPIWPRLTAVAWPWLASLVVLCAVAFAAGVDLRRAVRRR